MATQMSEQPGRSTARLSSTKVSSSGGVFSPSSRPRLRAEAEATAPPIQLPEIGLKRYQKVTKPPVCERHVSPPPVYYGPEAYGPPAWSPGWYDYCARRPGFDPHTGSGRPGLFLPLKPVHSDVCCWISIRLIEIKNQRSRLLVRPNLRTLA